LQAAAVEALSNPPSWYDTVNRVYSSRRKIVEEIMNILGCRFDKSQSGLFVWGRIPEEISDCESFMDEILNKTHVFITPGFIFGSQGNRYIRISLCADEEVLTSARNRIKEYMTNNY
jgi:LL-diaminopimelate aminotransferase